MNAKKQVVRTYTILSSTKIRIYKMRDKKKLIQLTFDFNQPINKPWWMGIVCKEMQYFDLLRQNIDLADLMEPWEIEDYKKTKLCHSILTQY